MIGRGCPQERAVETRSGLEQIDERQLGLESELEGDVAELDVEVDQAGFAAVRRLLLARSGSRAGLASAVAPTPPTLLMTLTSLALPARAAAWLPQLVGQRRERGFEILDAERQRNDVMRARADQRADERQRRIVSGGDQRRVGTTCASFWKRLIEAGVSGSTWTTAAAAADNSSGSIQSVSAGC